MRIDDLLQGRREEFKRIVARNGVTDIRLFGSFARGEAGPESDLDFLVTLEPNRSLLDLGRLSLELEEFFQRRVDLVEPEGLHRYLRDRILREAVPA